MNQELTEIKIPDAIQKALQERYEETGKLSSLNAKKLMADVPGTTRVDAQICIALFKENANPVHKDTIKLKELKGSYDNFQEGTFDLGDFLTECARILSEVK